LEKVQSKIEIRVSMLKLCADEVGLEEEDDIIVLGFKEKKSSNYLILSQDLNEIDGEGQTLYLEVKDQSNSGYGLVEKVVIRNSKIEIKLNSRGSEHSQIVHQFKLK
jgi:hypothetical protein